MWPFKRKPKVVDRRQPNDWRPGDRAICVRDDWSPRDPCDPEVGDVLTVKRVSEGLAHNAPVRCYWLSFRSITGFRYETVAFRKLVETDDAATIARIKGIKTPETADA